jgi:hypothetical protein
MPKRKYREEDIEKNVDSMPKKPGRAEHGEYYY